MDRRGFLRTGFAAGAAGLVLPFLDGRGNEAVRARASASAAEPTAAIRLNSNENALGIAPSARTAIIDAIGEGNRYPFGPSRAFVKQIADHHEVPEECVTLGCGSAEILQMSVQAFASGNALLITADPTFEAPANYAAPLGTKIVKVPLRKDFSHDIPKMRELSEKHTGPVLVYICNPNNPTGTITDCGEIEDWSRSAPERIRLLIDEAYFQFAKDRRYKSFVSLAADIRSLIVARTFSKVYAMAGLRHGYSITTPDTAARLALCSTGMSVNQLALAAASASLKDTDFLAQSLAVTDNSRKILLDALKELKIEHLPSEANFLMFRLKGTIGEFNRRMAARNILVGRPFPPMENYCRITIGLESEMRTFASALKEFRYEGWV